MKQTAKQNKTKQNKTQHNTTKNQGLRQFWRIFGYYFFQTYSISRLNSSWVQVR
jgi:hypothetical protein